MLNIRRNAAVCLILGAGCNLTQFDVTVQGDATIPGSTLGALLSSFPQLDGFDAMELSQSQEFKNQGVTASEVQSVKLTSLTLQIVSPSSQDFSFLDSIAFDVETDGGLVEVAHQAGISSLGLQAPNPTLSLEMDGPELVQEATAPSMTLTTQASGRQPAQDTQLHATAVFHVTAKL